VHLVGFNIKVYHDARSYERKKILYMDTSVYRDHGKMVHEQRG
jgi:hypothetical protein